MPSDKDFKVNEYITLKLEGGKTNIYVKGELFQQCKFLLLNIPVEEISSFDDIQSVDETAEKHDSSLEGVAQFHFEIPPEVKFWGHCSNMQVWAEHNYNTRILHRSIAFPLLKILKEKNDPIAKKVFNKEIAKRLSSGHLNVFLYLLEEGYIDYWGSEEFLSAFDNFNSLSDDFRDLALNTMETFFKEAEYSWQREKFIDFFALYGTKGYLINLIEYLVSITYFSKLRNLWKSLLTYNDTEARSLIKPVGRLILGADTSHKFKSTERRTFTIRENFIYLLLPYFEDLFTKVVGGDTAKPFKLLFHNLSIFIEMVLIINEVISSEIQVYEYNIKHFYDEREYDGGTDFREASFEFVMKENLTVKTHTKHITIEFSGGYAEPKVLDDLKKFNKKKYSFYQ